MTESFNYPVSNISNNYSISFEGHQRLEQNISEVTVPGISVGFSETFNMSKRVKVPHRSVEPEYDELIVNFNALEDYSNYWEVWTWIRDYKHSTRNGEMSTLMKDITLYNYNLNKDLIRKIYYKYCFPSMLSDVTVNNTQGDTEIAIFTVNFIVNDIIVGDLLQ